MKTCDTCGRDSGRLNTCTRCKRTSLEKKTRKDLSAMKVGEEKAFGKIKVTRERTGFRFGVYDSRPLFDATRKIVNWFDREDEDRVRG